MKETQTQRSFHLENEAICEHTLSPVAYLLFDLWVWVSWIVVKDNSQNLDDELNERSAEEEGESPVEQMKVQFDRAWKLLSSKDVVDGALLRQVLELALSAIQETQTQRSEKKSYWRQCVSHMSCFCLNEMVSGSGSLS